MTLGGKTALVTGSTSGIGLEIARTFAADGADVILNGFGDAEEIEATCAEIADAHGVEVIHSGADLSDAAQIEAMMAQADARFGGVDVLVNNAGIQHVARVEDFPPEKWDAILSIVLSGAFHTTRLAVPGMRRKGWGRIVNLASAHSLVASPSKSAYVAAKHGLSGLTKTVALETAEAGITCNCVSPGYVHTPLVESQIPETMEDRGMTREEVERDVILAAQPTKEFVTVEQVAAMVLFLTTENAASITGAPPVDGGWTAA